MVPVVKTGLSSGKSRICPFCGTNVDPFVEYFLIGIVILVFILFLASKLLPEKHTTQSTPETKTETTANSGTKSENAPTISPPHVDKESPLYKLGYEKGQLLAKKIVTDRISLLKEKCNEAMRKGFIQADEYLQGCMDGYDPTGNFVPKSNEEIPKPDELSAQSKNKASASTVPSPSSSYTSSETDRTRKDLERDEIRRKRDALQPILREGCLQGNEEACREYKRWEDIR